MSGMSSEEEFGKEVGLLHEVCITGRKAGADKDFWSGLAQNQKLFAEVVEFAKPRMLVHGRFRE